MRGGTASAAGERRLKGKQKIKALLEERGTKQMFSVSESRTSSLLTKGHLECLEQF